MLKSIQPKLKRLIDLAKFNVLSLLLHSVLLITLNGNKGFNGGDGNSRFKGVNTSNKDILVKEKKVEIVEVEVKSDKDEIIIPRKKKLVNVDKECPNDWYGGIGIRTYYDMNKNNDFVLDVFPGYPADIAGVRKEDMLIDFKSDDENIPGPPGTTVCLYLERNSKKLTICIKRGKVCYSAKKG